MARHLVITHHPGVKSYIMGLEEGLESSEVIGTNLLRKSPWMLGHPEPHLELREPACVSHHGGAITPG